MEGFQLFRCRVCLVGTDGFLSVDVSSLFEIVTVTHPEKIVDFAQDREDLGVDCFY